MSDEIKKFKKDMNSLTMSEGEKQRMKNTVFSYVEKNPVVQKRKGNIPSPYANLFNWYFSGKAFATYAAVLLIVFVGVSSSAEGSFPGDALYHVKVNINEPIVKSFSFTNEVKARTYASIAGRRLLEIEKITLEQNTDAELVQELNEEFKEHAAEVYKYVGRVKSSGDINEARKLSSDFETTLEIHSKILKEVDSDKQKIASSTENLSAIILEVENQENAIEEVNDLIDQEIASSTDEAAIDTLSEESLKTAEDEIEVLRDSIEDLEDSDEIDVSDEYKSLEMAESALEQAKEKSRENNDREAINLQNSASEIANEAQQLIKVQIDLKTDIFDDQSASSTPEATGV